MRSYNREKTKIQKQENGITLVALIITIIILVILAAVSINAAYNSGIINYAVNGTQKYIEESAKEKNSLGNAENLMKSALGIKEDEEVRGKTADELIAEAEDISSYYGKYVTNYVANTVDGIDYNDYNELLINDEEKWQIFYIGDAGDGENHIYLISSNYIHYDCMPLSPSGRALNKQSNYMVYFDNILSDYTGGSENVSEVGRFLNKEYFDYLEDNDTTSTYNNIKKVAYMTDTEVWDMYANEYADFAIGGPTIELFFKSYNEKYNKEYKEQNNKEKYQVSIDSAGYWESFDGGSNYNSNGPIATNDSLYVINSNMQSNGLFLASPGHIRYPASIVNVYYDGKINAYWNNGGDIQGFRPLICLSSDVRLEEDGVNYKIISDKPTFVLNYKITANNNYEILALNVQSNLNTNWQVKYKMENEANWRTSNSYNFIVNQDGIYKVKLIHGAVE